MNPPSRTMPPSPTPKKATFVTWLFLAAMLAGLAWGAFVSEPWRWFLIGTVTFFAVLSVLHSRRIGRIIKERREESICTFSRALPARAHDTWVVRAAYEELSDQAGAPIRPSDEVAKFWGIAGDDLDDAVLRIARRAGRSMEDIKKNPLLGRVVTVADMISFIEHQPREPIQIITDNSGLRPSVSDFCL